MEFFFIFRFQFRNNNKYVIHRYNILFKNEYLKETYLIRFENQIDYKNVCPKLTKINFFHNLIRSTLT